MRSCTLLCDSSRLLIYHKSEPQTPVLLESGVLGILVRAFPVLQHHRTYLLSYTSGFATRLIRLMRHIAAISLHPLPISLMKNIKVTTIAAFAVLHINCRSLIA